MIGARGGVSTSTLVGLAALRRGLTEETGLVGALPAFSGLPLATWDQLVVGGHEIRNSTLAVEAEKLHRESRVFESATLAACREDLDAADENIRPGVLWNVGSTIRGLAADSYSDDPGCSDGLGPRESIDRIQADLTEFRERHRLGGRGRRESGFHRAAYGRGSLAVDLARNRSNARPA